MLTSRRDALGSLAALGAGVALADASQAAGKGIDQRSAGAVPVAGDSVRPANQPRWARGIEGQRKPDLGDGRYLNPIIPGNASDPDIVRDGNDYYMVFSSFDDYPGLPLYHSQDLVNWVRIGSAISTPIGTVLAPSIARHGRRFFIYIAATAVPGLQGPRLGTYVVYADDIRGPWSEPVLVTAAGGIDPGHAVGEDGKRYLFYSGGTRMRLTDDGLKADGPVEKVYDGWKYPEDWYDQGFGLEGPKVLRRGGYFYLVCAEGGTYGPPTSHMVTVARSKSINGPWENSPGNPLVRTRSAAEPWWSRGHGVIVEGPAGDWWVVYHGYENGYRSLGRQALMEPVEWTADGWPRVVQRDLAQPIRSPRGGRNIGSGQPLSDDFTTQRIGTLWHLYLAGANETSRAVHGPGGLTLRGKGTNFAGCSPLTCIPVDRAYEVTVECELIDDIEAGLMLYIDPSLYAGLGHDGTRLHTYNKGAPPRFGQQRSAPGRHLWFKVIDDHQVVTMFWSLNGSTWTRLSSRLDVSSYNESVVAQGESLRIGLYAIGSGSARFRRFTYRALA